MNSKYGEEHKYSLKEYDLEITNGFILVKRLRENCLAQEKQHVQNKQIVLEKFEDNDVIELDAAHNYNNHNYNNHNNHNHNFTFTTIKNCFIVTGDIIYEYNNISYNKLLKKILEILVLHFRCNNQEIQNIVSFKYGKLKGYLFSSKLNISIRGKDCNRCISLIKKLANLKDLQIKLKIQKKQNNEEFDYNINC